MAQTETNGNGNGKARKPRAAAVPRKPLPIRFGGNPGVTGEATVGYLRDLCASIPRATSDETAVTFGDGYAEVAAS